MKKYLIIYLVVFFIGFLLWSGLYYVYTASILGVAKFRIDFGIRAGLVLGISITGLIYWRDMEKKGDEKKKRGNNPPHKV